MSIDRPPLTRERVLAAAVALADAQGVEHVSMRTLAHELGVVPMALYRHVAGKEELLDGMVDVVLSELDPPAPVSDDAKGAVRERILATRAALARHPWAPEVIATRSRATPAALAHMDALMGMFRAWGLSVDLTHHAMHTLGVRMWGFTRDVFPTPRLPDDPAARDAELARHAHTLPHIVELAGAVAAQGGCDADAEFTFALDLTLDGLERLRAAGWGAAPPSTRARVAVKQRRGGMSEHEI